MKNEFNVHKTILTVMWTAAIGAMVKIVNTVKAPKKK